jgi:hypothetical protein
MFDDSGSCSSVLHACITRRHSSSYQQLRAAVVQNLEALLFHGNPDSSLGEAACSLCLQTVCAGECSSGLRLSSSQVILYQHANQLLVLHLSCVLLGHAGCAAAAAAAAEEQ